MMLGCLALVGAICVNDSAEIKTSSTSLGRLAVIKVIDVEITSRVNSDNLISSNSLVKNICLTGCIKYVKKCSSENNAYYCSFYYSDFYSSYRSDFNIKGRSREAVSNSMSRIFLCVNGDCFRVSELD